MAPAAAEIADRKEAVRRRVWGLLNRERAVERDATGRIPDFIGADAAAALLAQTPAWEAASVVKAVPEHAQLPVRVRALADGKLLYMAVPRLAEDLPFYVLDPGTLTVTPGEAASSRAAAQIADKVCVEDMRPVDLVVCGSVAVNRDGAHRQGGGLLRHRGRAASRVRSAAAQRAHRHHRPRPSGAG